MTDVAPIVGLRIQMQRTIDKPCGACGHTIVVIGPGAGPHVASLHCRDCLRHRGWLPRTVADFLLAAIGRFGWPDEAIIIQDSEFVPESANAAPCAVPDSLMGAALDQDQETDA